MRKIVGKCFSNREIRLDGYAFVDCSFHSCRFVYSGRKDFSLTGNLVSSDCLLVFRDRAAETLGALSDLYELSDWGRDRVIAALGRIARVSEAVDIAVH